MPRRKRVVQDMNSEETAELEALLLEDPSADVFGRSSHELLWVDYYYCLLEKGYQLRPRFRPDWTPSWSGTNKYPMDCEDGWSRVSKLTLDAVRISDGKQVMIKRILPSSDNSSSNGMMELKIVQHLSSPDICSDARNHSMPYLDSFPIPGIPQGAFLVTPLFVSWDAVPLATVGQAVDFMKQIIEGLTFLHEQRIAHRDCTLPNLMMDWSPLVDEPFHPIRNKCSLDGEYFIDIRDRSQAQVRYYFIDFGLSTWFENKEGPFLVTGTLGRERAPPELRDGETKPYDPFKLDVFIIGALFQRVLTKRYHGFGHFNPLLRQMTSRMPNKRPTAAQVHRQFSYLTNTFSPRTLKWQLAPRKAGLLVYIILSSQGLVNQFVFAIQRAFRLLATVPLSVLP